jgi:hypothetical protein
MTIFGFNPKSLLQTSHNSFTLFNNLIISGVLFYCVNMFLKLGLSKFEYPNHEVELGPLNILLYISGRFWI